MSEDSKEALHDVVFILKSETDKLRVAYHEVVNDIAVLKSSIYKLENKTTCGMPHSELNTNLSLVLKDTAVIVSRLEGVKEHIETSKSYRDMTTRHEVELSNLKGVKELVQATLVTMIIAIIAALLKTTLYK